MKATIDIPDELYRRFKAKSALEGRPVRSVVVELVERWLSEDAHATSQSPAHPLRGLGAKDRGPTRSPEEWLEDWFRLGEEAFRDAPPGPSAREILEADRNRLERS